MYALPPMHDRKQYCMVVAKKKTCVIKSRRTPPGPQGWKSGARLPISFELFFFVVPFRVPILGTQIGSKTGFKKCETHGGRLIDAYIGRAEGPLSSWRLCCERSHRDELLQDRGSGRPQRYLDVSSLVQVFCLFSCYTDRASLKS